MLHYFLTLAKQSVENKAINTDYKQSSMTITNDPKNLIEFVKIALPV